MATRTPPRARDDARASPAPDKTCRQTPAPAPRSGQKGWTGFTCTDEFLAECRRRYEETTESVASIADSYGLSDKTVRRLADKHGWKKCRRGRIDLPPDVKLLRRAEALAAQMASGR